jgi:hypothetical protein
MSVVMKENIALTLSLQRFIGTSCMRWWRSFPKEIVEDGLLI